MKIARREPPWGEKDVAATDLGVVANFIKYALATRDYEVQTFRDFDQTLSWLEQDAETAAPEMKALLLSLVMILEADSTKEQS